MKNATEHALKSAHDALWAIANMQIKEETDKGEVLALCKSIALLELEQREHNQELACLVDDIAFKASLLRIAEKALEDIRGLCVSSTYWNNPDYPNCARLLKQHHKIVSDAKVKAEEMRAIEYGDDVEVPIREHS